MDSSDGTTGTGPFATHSAGDVRGDGDLVRAAGGIVVRGGKSGRFEVAVVHRPRRTDWSLPKGKLEPGELPEAGALREVEEETGLTCRLGRLIGYTEYVDRRGRPKIVAYWRMEVLSGKFRPNQEVDELRWAEGAEALDLLTYARDRDLLTSMEEFALARSG
ncbi:MAG: NUDIX hydrolase [Acidimicrobiales bacterium]